MKNPSWSNFLASVLSFLSYTRSNAEEKKVNLFKRRFLTRLSLIAAGFARGVVRKLISNWSIWAFQGPITRYPF